jgi:hypothetical protein
MGLRILLRFGPKPKNHSIGCICGCYIELIKSTEQANNWSNRHNNVVTCGQPLASGVSFSEVRAAQSNGPRPNPISDG